ncbi:MAG: hydroxyacylglutathione hydrolase [Gammaproteobacteria bacterium]|nr:MAG: hydroxyacylglutathione hydrolase [Gammaproteobacteria bacterium]
MLQVHRIPAFTDNYFWLIQPDTQSSDCYIVDPGAAQPVCDYLDAHKLQLKGILITHHHPDHIGGVSELRGLFQIPIYGPKSAKIPQVTHYLKEGDYLELGRLSAKVIEIPGHTLDHIAYLIEEPKDAPLLLSGDTIFAAGCGRLFDGTAPLLYAAFQKISQLPDATQIYAAHEYTLANIEFALTIEPDNHDLSERKIRETAKREQGLATLPTSLILEKRTNPFLRCHLNSVRGSVEQKIGKQLTEDGEIFASLRLIKDRF